MSDQFAKDVATGLGTTPKTLPSKYFYDAIGDSLFIKIMDLPEYYLTRAEMEIFTTQTDALIEALGQTRDKHFELVELGAGDGQKTAYLLAGLLDEGYDFTYVPVDISKNVLELLEARLREQLPALKIMPKVGDYFQQLNILHETHTPRALLYLGSNLGNLTDEKSALFMGQLAKYLKPKDRLVLGVDRIKAAEIVLPAYDDASGVTAAFNLNLLTRINRELGADFDLSAFRHAPIYNEASGVAVSYLESLKDQAVHVSKLGETYAFKRGETIKTEISRKYNREIVANIIHDTPFEISTTLLDSQNYFLDIIMLRT